MADGPDLWRSVDAVAEDSVGLERHCGMACMTVAGVRDSNGPNALTPAKGAALDAGSSKSHTTQARPSAEDWGFLS